MTGDDYKAIQEFATVTVVENEREFNTVYTTYYISVIVNETLVKPEHAKFYQWDVVLTDDYYRSSFEDDSYNEY